MKWGEEKSVENGKGARRGKRHEEVGAEQVSQK